MSWRCDHSGGRVGGPGEGGTHDPAGLPETTDVTQHAMWINPAATDHLIIGNDGGAYVSHDRGKTWDFLNHMAVGQFYNVAADLSDPYRVGGGLQDNGSWIGPSENVWQSGADSLGKKGFAITNADWHFINNGDGSHVSFDPNDPHLIYAESPAG